MVPQLVTIDRGPAEGQAIDGVAAAGRDRVAGQDKEEGSAGDKAAE
jgi:hypothetical protein